MVADSSVLEDAVYICIVLPRQYCCCVAPVADVWLAGTCQRLRMTVQHVHAGLCPVLDGSPGLSDWCSCSNQSLVAASWEGFGSPLQIGARSTAADGETKSTCLHTVLGGK